MTNLTDFQQQAKIEAVRQASSLQPTTYANQLGGNQQTKSAETLIQDAEKIYLWLIKEFLENTETVPPYSDWSISSYPSTERHFDMDVFNYILENKLMTLEQVIDMQNILKAKDNA